MMVQFRHFLTDAFKEWGCDDDDDGDEGSRGGDGSRWKVNQIEKGIKLSFLNHHASKY